MSEFVMQCEQCGDNVPESKAEMIYEPGYRGKVTLAFCPGCTDK